jgi:hypothetical protein
MTKIVRNGHRISQIPGPCVVLPLSLDGFSRRRPGEPANNRCRYRVHSHSRLQSLQREAKATAMEKEQLDGRTKRRYYIVAFCFALVIDLLFSFARDAPYRPSLVGLAIMIASVLYFVHSWIRER